jgi:hypothetical protein
MLDSKHVRATRLRIISSIVHHQLPERVLRQKLPIELERIGGTLLLDTENGRHGQLVKIAVSLNAPRTTARALTRWFLSQACFAPCLCLRKNRPLNSA